MAAKIIPFRKDRGSPSVSAQREIARKVTMCLQAIAGLEAKVESRPNLPPGSSDIVLARPACQHRCATCFMECAIAPSRLAWWEKELAALGGVRKAHLIRDGIDATAADGQRWERM